MTTQTAVRMSIKRLTVAAGLAAGVALALPASGASAAPITLQFHGAVTQVFPNDNLCGIDGSSVINLMDNIQVLGDGTFKDESQFVGTFTSAATGKSVQLSNHEAVQGGVPVDNGNGTATVVNNFNGIPMDVKLASGPMLALDAGRATFTITFDTATGQVIGVTTSIDGPHPILLSGGSVICDAVVSALG